MRKDCNSPKAVLVADSLSEQELDMAVGIMLQDADLYHSVRKEQRLYVLAILLQVVAIACTVPVVLKLFGIVGDKFFACSLSAALLCLAGQLKIREKRQGLNLYISQKMEILIDFVKTKCA